MRVHLSAGGGAGARMGGQRMCGEEERDLVTTLGAGMKWFKENFSSSLHRRQSPDMEMYGVVRLQFLDK